MFSGRILQFLVGGTTLLWLSSCSYTIIEKPGSRDLLKADRLWEEGNKQESIRYYQQAANEQSATDIQHRALARLAEVETKENKRISMLKRSSALGNERATYVLAQEYRKNGNPDKALTLLRSIQESYPAALLDVAQLTGGNTEQLVQQAIASYEADYAAGNISAALALARLYADGVHTPKNDSLADAWYEKAIRGGHVFAAMEYAERLSGRGDIKQGIDLFEQLVEAGEVRAYVPLADLWLKNSPADPNKALILLNAAVEKTNDPLALTKLGRMYRDGVYVGYDTHKALALFERATTQNFAPAMISVGRMHWVGIEGVRNPVKAQAYFLRAANTGDASAMALYGNTLQEQGQVQQAMHWYQRAYEAGSGLGARYLAELYANGMAGSAGKNLAQAAHYMQESSNMGNSSAALWLSQYYMFSSPEASSGQNLALAKQYALKAMEKHHVAARVRLAAIALLEGDNASATSWLSEAHTEDALTTRIKSREFLRSSATRADKIRFLELYKPIVGDKSFHYTDLHRELFKPERAASRTAALHNLNAPQLEQLAQNGKIEAMYHLAVMYADGRGVEIDKERSTAWLTKAANAGHANSILRLARAFAVGNGVPMSATKAVEWYQKGAELGSPDAQYQLGLAYARGVGITKDTNAARHWLEKAAKNGFSGASAVLESLE